MAHTPVILVLDDDPELLTVVEEIIEEQGWIARCYTTGAHALEAARQDSIDCAIIDITLPDINGLEVLRLMRNQFPLVPLFILTGDGYDVDNAVIATKAGATNFFGKPISKPQLVQTLRNALETMNLRIDREYLMNLTVQSRGLVGQSEAMRKVYFLLQHYVQLDQPVLILGETGTGCSVLAESIHALSRRKDGPYITVDCSRYPEEELARELYGVCGEERPGALARASGGSLYIDGIHLLGPQIQASLRRYLETGLFRRVGECEEQQADTRVLASANRDLKRAVAEGNFMRELNMKLHTFSITLPPLEERREDIPLIASGFLRQAGKQLQKPFTAISEQGKLYLTTLSFPGNLRSLQSLIQRAVALTPFGPEKQELDEHDLHLAVVVDTDDLTPMAPGHGFKAQVELFKRNLVIDALVRNQFSMKKAAESLSIGLDNLCHKVKSYGIAVEELRRRQE